MKQNGILNNFIFTILLCFLFSSVKASHFTIPTDTSIKNLIHSFHNPAPVVTCNDDAGHLTTYIDGNLISNSVINFVNYGSTVQFVHSGGNANYDGNTSTLPGFDVGIYIGSPPASIASGPTAATINSYPSFSGSFVGTSIDGSQTITNLGAYQNAYNNGYPIHLWFAPITLDDHANQIITENVGSPNECANVATSEQINMVFLDQIDTFGFTNPAIINGDSCVARIRIQGGLPQWDASFYTINVHLKNNPSIIATIVTPPATYNSLIQFTVPQAGYYDINISDDNGASRTFTVPMFGCQNTCSSFSIVENTLCPNDSIIVNGVTYNQQNPIGTEIITSGNYQGCDSTIYIDLSFDNTLQLVSSPTDINHSITSNNCQQSINWVAPVVLNSCNQIVTPTFQSHHPNDTFYTGTTTVTYLYDNYGDTLIITFDISIIDTIKPTLQNCPTDTILSCSNMVFWSPITATDNCGNVTISSTHQSNTTFPNGATDVFYYADDGNGNHDTCHFVVLVQSPSDSSINTTYCGMESLTINGTLYNRQNPTGTEIISNGNSQGCDSTIHINLNYLGTTPILVSTINHINQFIDSISCKKSVSWTAPIVTDSCNQILTPIAQSHYPSDTFGLGITTVVYVYENHGDTLIASFDVTIVDTVKPTFANCPNDTIISCTNIVTWLPPSATDNCGNVMMSSSHQPNTTFTNGATEVFYYADDGNGNHDTCHFVVLVVDTPQIIIDTSAVTCFGDSNGFAIFTLLSGQPPFTFAWDTTILQTIPNFNNLTAGNYSVTLTDGYGCSSVYPFTIPQPSAIIPIITAIADTNNLGIGQITLNASGGVPPYNYQWDTSVTPTSIDTVFNLGAGTYYVTITDANGCTSVNLVVVDSVTTNIKELNEVKNLKIFPNPTTGNLSIDLEMSDARDVNVSIYSISGQLIRDFGHEYTSRAQIRTDLSTFPSGVYMVRFVIDDQVVTKRLILSKY